MDYHAPACQMSPSILHHDDARSRPLVDVPGDRLGDQIALVIKFLDVEHRDGWQVSGWRNSLRLPTSRPSAAISSSRSLSALRSAPLMPKALPISRLPTLSGDASMNSRSSCLVGTPSLGTAIRATPGRPRPPAPRRPSRGAPARVTVSVLERRDPGRAPGRLGKAPIPQRAAVRAPGPLRSVTSSSPPLVQPQPPSFCLLPLFS